MKNKIRKLYFYKEYFDDFFIKQNTKVKEKILWTLELLEEFENVPGLYLKHVSGTNGLFEIRIQQGNNMFRIFCFFDKSRLVVIITGFQKKSQKLPVKEIKRAIKIMEDYYNEEKESDITF